MDSEAVIVTLGFFILTYGFVLGMRYLGFRERMALMERGLYNSRELSRSDGKNALRWGIATALLGVALSLGLYSIGFEAGAGFENAPLRLGPWMLGGFIPLFFGLALILSYYLTREPDRTPSVGNQSVARDDNQPVAGSARTDSG